MAIGEISFPLDLMRGMAQQITSETQHLSTETSASWTGIQRDMDMLPGTVQARLRGNLSPLQQQVTQLLLLRQQLGARLTTAADEMQSLDNRIAQNF